MMMIYMKFRSRNSSHISHPHARDAILTKHTQLTVMDIDLRKRRKKNYTNKELLLNYQMTIFYSLSSFSSSFFFFFRDSSDKSSSLHSAFSHHTIYIYRIEINKKNKSKAFVKLEFFFSFSVFIFFTHSLTHSLCLCSFSLFVWWFTLNLICVFFFHIREKEPAVERRRIEELRRKTNETNKLSLKKSLWQTLA